MWIPGPFTWSGWHGSGSASLGANGASNTFGDHAPKELWDEYRALVPRLG